MERYDILENRFIVLDIKLPYNLFSYGVIQVSSQKILVLGGKNELLKRVSNKVYTVELVSGKVKFLTDLPQPLSTNHPILVKDNVLTILYDENRFEVPNVAFYNFTLS
jgi:hypothetical protein